MLNVSCYNINKKALSIFNKFFRKNSDSNIKVQFESVKLEFENKDYRSVLELGVPLVDLSKDLQKVELKKKVALSYFREKQFTNALPYFQDIAMQSNISSDWFNVATTSILCKQIDTGMKAFGRAIELAQQDNTNQSIPVGQMSLYVMHALKDIEEYDLAFVQMMKLKDVYTRLKITDVHFLYVRGLPSIREVLTAGKVVLEKQKIANIEEWLIDFENRIDEEGQQFIKEYRQNLNYSS